MEGEKGVLVTIRILRERLEAQERTGPRITKVNYHKMHRVMTTKKRQVGINDDCFERKRKGVRMSSLTVRDRWSLKSLTSSNKGKKT